MIGLGIALCAMGWRAWGHGPVLGMPNRVVGTFLMTMGLWLNGDYPVWAFAVLAACVFTFRVKSPHKWWQTFQAEEWSAAFGRSLWIMPLLIALAVLQGSVLPVLHGGMAIPAVPTGYWAGYKLTMWFNSRFGKYGLLAEIVATGEIIVGIILGVCGV